MKEHRFQLGKFSYTGIDDRMLFRVEFGVGPSIEIKPSGAFLSRHGPYSYVSIFKLFISLEIKYVPRGVPFFMHED